MKKILIVGLILSVLPLNLIKEIKFIDASAFAYDIKSGAIPNDARMRTAVHYFTINVPSTGLSSLTIEIPEGVKVNGEIKVKNQDYQTINSDFSVHNNKAVINFPTPVSEDNSLMIRLEDVSTTGYSNAWMYRIHGTMAEVNQTMPLGSRRVQTYD